MKEGIPGMVTVMDGGIPEPAAAAPPSTDPSSWARLPSGGVAAWGGAEPSGPGLGAAAPADAWCKVSEEYVCGGAEVVGAEEEDVEKEKEWVEEAVEV